MRSPARRGSLRRAAVIVAAAGLGLAGTGCQKRSPAIEYMPNMAYGPRVAAQHEDPLRPGYSVNRPPVPGTVARDVTPYRFAQGDTAQAMEGMVMSDH